MANIKEYNAGPLALQIPETGIEATAQAARRVGTLFNQAGEAKASSGARIGAGVRDLGDAGVSYLEHREKSHGSAGLAGLVNDWSQQLADRAKTADPNDPTILSKFVSDVVEPGLKGWQDQFYTEGAQTWAENRVEAVRTHFMTKSTAEQMALAGAAAVNNIYSASNNFVHQAWQHPEDIDFLLKQADELVDANRYGVSPEKWNDISGPLRQRTKANIVHAGIRGLYDQDPAKGDQMVESGKYAQFVNRSELDNEIKYGRYMRRAQDADERAARQTKRYEDKEISVNRAHELILELTDPVTGDPKQPNKNWLANVIANRDQKLQPSEINFIAQQYNRMFGGKKGKPIQDSPELIHNLIGRIMKPASDPDHMTIEELQSQHLEVDVSSSAYHLLYGIATKRGTPSTKAESQMIQQQIRHIRELFPARSDFGISDKAMQEAQTRFLNDYFLPQYAARREAGDSAFDLLDSSSSKYLMKPEVVKKFMPTPTSTLDSATGTSRSEEPGLIERFFTSEKAKRDAAEKGGGTVVTKPSSLTPVAPPKAGERAPVTPAIPPPAVPFAPTPDMPIIDFRPGANATPLGTRKPLGAIFGVAPKGKKGEPLPPVNVP